MFAFGLRSLWCVHLPHTRRTAVTVLQRPKRPIPLRGPAVAALRWGVATLGPTRSSTISHGNGVMRHRRTKRYFQQLFALYAGLVGAR